VIVLGLTGSIGMGKSTAARALRQMGIPVLEADRVVHRLTAPNGRALPAIAKAFPGTVTDGRLDRGKMAGLVFGDQAALERLEAILHPLYEDEERRFVARARGQRRRMVAIDIPLMYEVGADRRMDAVVVLTAPAFVQRARVMARPGMTAARFAGVLARQMPDREKRRRADFIVPTGLDRREAFRRVKAIVESVKRKPPTRRQHQADPAGSQG
jgi:dephospho-CoA kinase